VTSTPTAGPQSARRLRAERDERSASSLDLLRTPGLGRFLRWRHSRRVMQFPMLLLSGIMIMQAFWGPQLAPKNLATLLTWVHFRGLVVLVALLAGNLFCMACPFLLPRELARRFHIPGWEWPRALRNKWPAIVLLVVVLFVYELFDLWGDPWWTGVMIVSYFAAATLIDALFRRGSFCKYVCPVGQFNFLSSAISPLEVAVRDSHVCTHCQTKDCIRGVRATADRQSTLPAHELPIVQRGCELALFQPRKVGNLDCTFCLDCVYACPHDNIGLLTRLPAEELTVGGTRSGIGKLERRTDYAVLMTVFTFGALLNAFAMISPVYVLEQWLAERLGISREWPILLGLFVVALIIEPVILLGLAGAATRRLAHCQESVPAIVKRFTRSLVPLGFGVWLAHYGFHFFTGFLTIVPVTQNAVVDMFGRAWLGEPLWQLGGLPEAIVFPMEVGFMILGLLGSWLTAWLIAQELTVRRHGLAVAPWALLHVLLFATAVWIMNQPMDMRGTFLGG
jgi:ferredoxin